MVWCWFFIIVIKTLYYVSLLVVSLKELLGNLYDKTKKLSSRFIPGV